MDEFLREAFEAGFQDGMEKSAGLKRAMRLAVAVAKKPTPGRTEAAARAGEKFTRRMWGGPRARSLSHQVSANPWMNRAARKLKRVSRQSGTPEPKFMRLLRRG